MLTIIPLLTFLMFSITYPLCFWLSAHDPLKNKFHHFHIGLPNLTAGLSVLGMFMLGLQNPVIYIALIWLGLFFVITFLSWDKETVNVFAVSFLSGFGMLVYVLVQGHYLGGSIPMIVASVFSGLILSLAFYAMNLGHWYLNVHGLPLIHLKRATIAFAVVLCLRLLWDVVIFLTSQVIQRGEYVSIATFILRLDGIFLFIAFFFGTIFPLIALWFVWGTLKVKSTQSATGILYVVLSSVLIGDITFKYYLLYYHLAF